MACTLKRFRVLSTTYRLDIFTEEDDRTEVINDKNEVLLTFTANCEVYAGKPSDKVQLGRTTMRDSRWVLIPEPEPVGRFFSELPAFRDIYDLEEAIAKVYIEVVFDAITKLFSKLKLRSEQ